MRGRLFKQPPLSTVQVKRRERRASPTLQRGPQKPRVHRGPRPPKHHGTGSRDKGALSEAQCTVSTVEWCIAPQETLGLNAPYAEGATGQSFASLSDALGSTMISSRYQEAYFHEATEEQDLRILERMNDEWGEWYDLIWNNCGDLVKECLEAGDLPYKDLNNPNPRGGKQYIKKHYKNISDRLGAEQAEKNFMDFLKGCKTDPDTGECVTEPL